MNQSFIAMLAAIESPEAIERGYQILAAKRSLLALHKAEKTVKFAHTYMEPRPLVDTKCAAIADLKRLKDVTPAMARNGFHNGMVFRMVKGGHQTSTLRHVRSGRVATIHNRYLESFFKPAYQGSANVNF